MALFPAVSPDMDSEYSFDPLLLNAPFGDGYYQTAGDGIRPYTNKWTMKFSHGPKSTIDTIAAFLDGLNGASFQWQSPLSATVTNWKFLNGYKRGKTGPNAYDITFEIEGVTL